MLFGLCCMIGVGLGARKTARLQTIRSLRGDLQLFSERIASGRGTLTEIAGEQGGALTEMLQIYLDRLAAGSGETEAAKTAFEDLHVCETVREGIRIFLTGLSTATRGDLKARTKTLSATLDRAESEAETEAKQARVLRVSGVLIGAGLAILLM